MDCLLCKTMVRSSVPRVEEWGSRSPCKLAGERCRASTFSLHLAASVQSKGGCDAQLNSCSMPSMPAFSQCWITRYLQSCSIQKQSGSALFCLARKSLLVTQSGTRGALLQLRLQSRNLAAQKHSSFSVCRWRSHRANVSGRRV